MTDARFLVASHVGAVRAAVAALAAHLGTESLLSKVGTDPKLRRGLLDSATAYAFHGVGCRMTAGEGSVDFGPDGAVGGFDAWRVGLYAEGEPSKLPEWQDAAHLESALRHLHAPGLIESPGSALSPHLYYLTKDGEMEVATRLASSVN